MTPELPGPLQAAIDRMLEGVSRNDLAERAARTSEAYRAGRPSSGVIRKAEDALAYALTRLPATYAACATALAEAARMAPAFAPLSLLDAGVGTGAASWAAHAVWPGISEATWLDHNGPFLDLAARLAEGGPTVLDEAKAVRTDLAASGDWPTTDLVLASYALAELPVDQQHSALTELWASTRGLLAIIEPGTPAGFGRIEQARQALLDQGARILAPCPQGLTCPVAAPDWCHFSVRLPRRRDHRLAKSAQTPFEDEPFSYLIAARPGIAAIAPTPRILAPPRHNKPGITLKLCGLDGRIETRLVTKRDKAAIAETRRLDWGDALPPGR